MHFSSLFLASSVATTIASSASLFAKRVSTPHVNDGIILNYALTIEYLQQAFYRRGLEEFKGNAFSSVGFAHLFRDNLIQIYSDKKTHIAFLTKTLTAAKIPAAHELTYSFPYTNAQTFVQFASVLEGVGVSAYRYISSVLACIRAYFP